MTAVMSVAQQEQKQLCRLGQLLRFFVQSMRLTSGLLIMGRLEKFVKPEPIMQLRASLGTWVSSPASPCTTCHVPVPLQTQQHHAGH